jgi:hypothetical protein
MKTTGAVVVALLTGLLIIVPAPSFADTDGHRPPTDLKLVGDHWTPWDPPEAGPNDYIIEKGDTLWDLAGEWLGDPYLWPQVWDENRYILDSHWIYPGDPLVVPGRPTVVPPDGPPTGEKVGEGEGEDDSGLQIVVDEEQPVREVEIVEDILPPRLVPVGDPYDVDCTGYIATEHQFSELWIVGRETERTNVAQGNIIYLSQGRNQGIEAGSEWRVIRKARPVMHPETGDLLGSYVRRLGKVRIIATQENTSTALITESCSDIVDSDELVAWSEIPIPARSFMPEFDRFDVTPSGGPEGYIVAFKDDDNSLGWARRGDMGVNVVGTGHVVYLDLGEEAGVEPGDVLTIFRPRNDLPRWNIGQLVVLTVEDGTSTAKVARAVSEIFPGDRVELLR